MSALVGDSHPFDAPAGPVPVVRVGPQQYVAAAERLVSADAGPRSVAAERFVAAAPGYGIDLSLMWAAVDGRGRPAQVCLAVVGTGRTAMLFVSNGSPPQVGGPAGREIQHRRRVAVVRAACGHLAGHRDGSGRSIRLVQSLLEPCERAAIRAVAEAGFIRLGDLAYLRLRRPKRAPVSRRQVRDPLPTGVAARSVDEIPPQRAQNDLIRALERSYVDTLDCPELCGLRRPEDVLESHRAVGAHDPALWWVFYEGGPPEAGGRPEGCMLLNPCPDQDTIELVYLGLSPSLRGRGIGSAALAMGLERLRGRSEGQVTCAVDTRNGPAMRLYERAGFSRFGLRVPLVCALPGAFGA